MDLDMHVDTCVLGANFVIMAYTEQVCSVQPYHNDYKSIENVPIVSGATVTQVPNRQVIILVINQTIWMGDTLLHSLINPNQLQHHGVRVMVSGQSIWTLPAPDIKWPI